ncbi:MAG: MTH1187 family thiamine-binding protein [Anaerolineales bacterium]|jgi:uncharacterized protein (TIGR00106 family)
MKAIADVMIVPVGVGLSLSKYVAHCEQIFKKAGLNPHLHAYGTNLEGSWDDIVAAVKQCHQELHDMGVPRISSSIKIGTRTDRDQSMQDKIDSVDSKLTVTGDEG